jgi:23S rRNA pseudouridine955/2504/2580 synthase
VDGKEGERRVKVTTKDDPDGMKSVTLVKVARVMPQPLSPPGPAVGPTGMAKHDAMTLLEVTLKTGRTHQIRVHLASEGHPIAGDDKYGDFEWNKELQKQGLKRMFLHAWQLRFSHPADQHAVSLLAELPAELRPWAGLAKPSTPE